MKTFEKYLEEASVSYTVKPTKRFRVKGPETFKDLQAHPDIKKNAGPNTEVFDASNEERVKKAPGENKWNALLAMYGNDEDEIACAKGGAAKDGGFEWFCLAVKVSV